MKPLFVIIKNSEPLNDKLKSFNNGQKVQLLRGVDGSVIMDVGRMGGARCVKWFPTETLKLALGPEEYVIALLSL